RIRLHHPAMLQHVVVVLLAEGPASRRARQQIALQEFQVLLERGRYGLALLEQSLTRLTRLPGEDWRLLAQQLDRAFGLEDRRFGELARRLTKSATPLLEPPGHLAQELAQGSGSFLGRSGRSRLEGPADLGSRNIQ